MDKASPDTVGVALNDKGAHAVEMKLKSFPGPTTKYGKSLGPTGNAGSPSAACQLLSQQDDRYSKGRK